MRRNFTLRFLASTILVLTAIVVNAQDANNPWHFIALENDTETAAYSADSVVNLVLSTANVTVAFQGQSFDHPRTVKFGVAPRRNGTGTANEIIVAPQWTVFYANGNLKFSKPVNGGVIYAFTGALAAQFVGNNTEFQVPSLNPGIYVVQAGGKSAKFVVSNGSGGSQSQPVAETTAATYAFADTPVELRSTGIKNYLNVTSGKSTASIAMAEIKELYFISNTLVCVRKDGSTIEFQDYKGMVPSNTAVPAPTSGWLLSETLVYGQCSYAMRAVGVQRTVVFAAVHKDGIAFQSMFLDGTDPRYQWFPNSGINAAMWNAAKANSGSRLSVFVSTAWNYGITYPTTYMGAPAIEMTRMTGAVSPVTVENWTFNGNDNRIPTVTTLNADGSITMSCKDSAGKTQTHTFVNP